MNLKRIKHTFRRMSIEEKVVGLGAITVIIGITFPWYQEKNLGLAEGYARVRGFEGDVGVIGFVMGLMALLSIFYLLAENLHIRLPQFGYKKSQILFFLMGQSFFLNLIALAIYLKIYVESYEGDLFFGIYIALIGSFLATFAAFAKVKKVKEKQVKEFFHQNESESGSSEEREDTGAEPMYFGEDKTGPVISPAFQASDPTDHNLQANSEPSLPEDDMMDEVAIVEKKDPPHHNDSNQASFFGKEAGIK